MTNVTLRKKQKDPLEQKASLIKQLKDIETKIADFDKGRSKKVAALATQHRLVDLSDDLLETEFKLIREKYQATLTHSQPRGDGKKNS